MIEFGCKDAEEIMVIVLDSVHQALKLRFLVSNPCLIKLFCVGTHRHAMGVQCTETLVLVLEACEH
jgi:hypothetical protein